MYGFLHTIKNVVSRKTKTSQGCIRFFFQQKGNQWILNNPKLAQSLVSFFQQLPETDLHKVLVNKKLVIHYCNPIMSCTFFQYKNREVLLVFPDLLELLCSENFILAHAILAHEFGHVFLEHSKKEIGYLAAQLEADRYAWKIGLGEYLLRTLKNEHWSDEVAERVSVLNTLIKA